MWGVLGKIHGAKECGLRTMVLQHVKNASHSRCRHLHGSFQRDFSAMLTGQVKLLRVET
jgi:predicted nucleic acid-binding Zn ribbon protein